MSVTLKNPHSVIAVLKSRPKDVLTISVTPSAGEGWEHVEALAKKSGVAVRVGQSARGGSPKNPNDGGRSGAEANVKERAPVALESLFENAKERAGGHGLWLALDQVQDPQNVGAIFRSAGFFGVQGIVLLQDRAAPLNGPVYDVASGGVETVPFCTVPNLQRAFEVAKEAGLWILGTSEHAKEPLNKIENDRPWLLVLGNEEKGLRRLTEESCDLLCAIKPKGAVTSLNVSVAAGICISHLSGV